VDNAIEETMYTFDESTPVYGTILSGRPMHFLKLSAKLGMGLGAGEDSLPIVRLPNHI
jgi:hypothetical protein